MNKSRIRTSAQMLRPALLSLLLSPFIAANAWAQLANNACGTLTNSFGPFDYRNEVGTQDYKKNPNNPLYLVESTHFRPEMEALIRGGQGANSPVGPEFDYTLRAFPNHHRALIAMVRLAEMQKVDPPKGARYTVACWFERAIRFRSDDHIVRIIYATYLNKAARREDAIRQLEAAAKLAKDNAFSLYNIGMVYADMEMFDRALEYAHASEALGMQRTELKDRLVAAGHWREPAPQGPQPAASSSPAPSAPSGDAVR